MKWASSLSTATRLETAVREAALGIKEKLEGAAPDFAALFVAQSFAERREDIQNLVAKHLPARVLVGASAAGVIGGGREWESKAGLSLVAAVLPDVKLRTFAIRDEDLPDLDDSPRAWESLVGVRAAEEPQFVVLADPFSIRLDNFLSGLDYAFPKSVKVGGVASGASEPGRGALYLNDQCLRGGLVGVSFTGNLRIDSVVAQGCRPIGRPLRVTGCKENALLAVDGKPPVEILQTIFKELSDRDRQLLRQALFIGIAMTSSADAPQPGDFLVRNIVGVDNDHGYLAVAAPLRLGQTVQFHLRDSRSSLEDLRQVFARFNGGAAAPHGALLFSCVGRGEALYGKADHDSAFFEETVGPVPLGGFFCNGEIGPVGGTTYLHGYTSCFGLFRSKT